MTFQSHWPTALCWGAAIPCWLMAAYYTIKFQTRFEPIVRAGQIPKGLSPRIALFWAEYPPECGTLRRKVLKWGAGFILLLLIGTVLEGL